MPIRAVTIAVLFVLLALSSGWGVFQGRRASAAAVQIADLRAAYAKAEQRPSEKGSCRYKLQPGLAAEM